MLRSMDGGASSASSSASRSESQRREMCEFPDDVVYASKIRDIISGDLGGRSTEPAHLLPHMYLGSQRNAERLRLLRKLGITHVLNCAGYKGPREFPNRSPYEGLGIEYYEFKAEDHECYDITQHFREAFNFLDKVKRTSGVCLVHCALGINRSSAVCVAYLMTNNNMTLLKAIKHVKSRRRVVLSNEGFRRQLVRFARQTKMLDPLPREQPVTRTSRPSSADELYMSFARGCFVDKTRDEVPYQRLEDGLSSRSTASTFSSASLRSASAPSQERVPGDTALNYLYDKFMNREKI